MNKTERRELNKHISAVLVDGEAKSDEEIVQDITLRTGTEPALSITRFQLGLLVRSGFVTHNIQTGHYQKVQK